MKVSDLAHKCLGELSGLPCGNNDVFLAIGLNAFVFTGSLPRYDVHIGTMFRSTHIGSVDKATPEKAFAEWKDKVLPEIQRLCGGVPEGVDLIALGM